MGSHINRQKEKLMANAKEVEVEEGPKEVRIKPDLEKYVNGVSASGKKTKNCGDEVAVATDGFSVEELAAVASKLRDVTAKSLIEKYSHLNIGMQAMNIRNLIRGGVAKLDKAHEADKAVVAGIPTLKLECTKPQAAVAKRAAAAEKAAAERAAKAAKAAEAKAAKEAKGKAKKAA